MSVFTRGFASALCVLTFAVALPGETPELGSIEFPTSGPATAQQQFIRGVLLLHSFEYKDARSAFREAERLAPTFAMAYWGDALTENQTLWMHQDVSAARATLNRLAPTAEARLAKAPTEREKGYLRAVEALYGAGDKRTRDVRYAESMRRMHERYPDDLEAASLYALALLGTCEGQRDYATYMKAAAIVEEVFAANPRHPGAAHYLIHSYDDPVHAPLGLRAARVYGKIAGAAPHAQHMPSHIFLALGMWDDETAANEISWRVSDERVTSRKLPIEERGYHALQWLGYGYLQQGRYGDARKTLATMEEDTRKSGSPLTRSHLALMRSAYMVETQRWDTGLAPLDYKGLRPAVVAVDLFTTGMSAIKAGDLAGARRALAAMRAIPAVTSPEPDMHHGAGAPDSEGNARQAMASKAMALELEGLVQAADGRRDEALDLMKKAAAVEDAMPFDFGPPVPVKPAHELYGEMLLDAGQVEEARTQFELALARAPGRALSLMGLLKSARQSGEADEADETAAQLRRNWHRADADVLQLLEGAAGSGGPGGN
jgi:tetratricopeptide (TPR) repeat protein